MQQQLIAIIVIIYIIIKIVLQKKQNKISQNEFALWLIFWFFVMLAIIFIKQIDSLVAMIGFSATGIDVLLYLSVAWLFYYVFKMRIKMEKMEKNITALIRQNSLHD